MSEELYGAVESNRGAAGVGSVLVLAVLLGLAWLAYRASAAPVNKPPPRAVARAVAERPVWPAELVPESAADAASSAAMVLVPAVPAPAASSVVPAVLADDGRCASAGPLQRAEAGASGVLPSEAALASRERFQAALASRTDDVSRATALVLQSQGGRPVLDSELACEGSACPAQPEKVESPAAARARVAANNAPRDALARMALVSTSPDVYAMAWQTCRQHGTQDAGSACQMLTVRQWARLDAGNAAPWLEIAAVARERGDFAEVDEAMFHVAKSRTADYRWGAAVEALVGRLPEGLPAFDAVQLGRELLAMQNGLALRDHQLSEGYCKAENLADANRRLQCGEIAEMLLTRGRSLQDFSAGIALSKQLGAPGERVEALVLEQDAMRQALAKALPALPARASCVAVLRNAAHLRAVGAAGELRAAREFMAVSGTAESDPAALQRAQAPIVQPAFR